MTRLILLGLLVLALTLLPKISAQVSPVLVCYWDSQSHHRLNEGRFSVEDIDPDLCTHIIYQTAVINSRTFEIQSGDDALDYGPTDDPPGINDMFRKVLDLKTKNSGLQVFLSVGGAKVESKVFSDMANVPSNRKLFVDSVVKLFTEFMFDGLDVDWQYPTLGLGREEDPENFVTLMKELKEALEDMAPPRKLTAVVGNLNTQEMRDAYNFTLLAEHVNFFNVKTFEYMVHWNGSYDTETISHHSKLHPSGEDGEEFLATAQDATLKYIISEDVPLDKIVLGVAAYGRTYTLKTRGEHDIGDAAEGPGIPFQFTKEPGKIAYFEVCLNLAGIAGWDFVYNDRSVYTYAYNRTQWIGFDDVDSVNKKVEWAMRKNQLLGGIAIWSLDLDDCKNYCGGWETTCRLTQLIKDRL